MSGKLQVGVGILEGVEAVLDRHQPADVLGGAGLLDVGPDPRGEGAAGADAAAAPAGQAPLGVALGLLLPGHGQHPLVDAELIRWLATTKVVPPTLPAVWTRSSGLPTAPRASARNSSGCMMPSKASGALPMTTASMSVQEHSASSSARSAASRSRPGDGDVVPALLVLGLADADDGAAFGHLLTLQDADQVLLQALAAGGVGQGPVGLAVGDPGGRFDDADQPGGHDRVGGQGSARRVDVGRRAPRPSASRRISSWGLKAAASSTTSSGPPS